MPLVARALTLLLLHKQFHFLLYRDSIMLWRLVRQSQRNARDIVVVVAVDIVVFVFVVYVP